MNDRPRILFFGYSEVGYACLSLLIERGDNVVALITHEDNPSEKIWFKTPAVAAKEKGIPYSCDNATIAQPEWYVARRPPPVASASARARLRDGGDST